MTHVVTPEGRGLMVFLTRPSKPRDAAAEQAEKFTLRLAFPPEADLSDLKKEVENIAANHKWKSGKVPKNLRLPFRLNEDLDEPIEAVGGDWTIMTFSAPANRRPGLVDANLQDIVNEADVYSGAWFRAQVDAYAYEVSGNSGVTFGLLNVMKTRDDDPIGKATVSASKAFSGFTPAASGKKNASSIFG